MESPPECDCVSKVALTAKAAEARTFRFWTGARPNNRSSCGMFVGKVSPQKRAYLASPFQAVALGWGVGRTLTSSASIHLQ